MPARRKKKAVRRKKGSTRSKKATVRRRKRPAAKPKSRGKRPRPARKAKARRARSKAPSQLTKLKTALKEEQARRLKAEKWIAGVERRLRGLAAELEREKANAATTRQASEAKIQALEQELRAARRAAMGDGEVARLRAKIADLEMRLRARDREIADLRGEHWEGMGRSDPTEPGGAAIP